MRWWLILPLLLIFEIVNCPALVVLRRTRNAARPFMRFSRSSAWSLEISPWNHFWERILTIFWVNLAGSGSTGPNHCRKRPNASHCTICGGFFSVGSSRTSARHALRHFSSMSSSGWGTMPACLRKAVTKSGQKQYALPKKWVFQNWLPHESDTLQSTSTLSNIWMMTSNEGRLGGSLCHAACIMWRMEAGMGCFSGGHVRGGRTLSKQIACRNSR
mmetsp:Transcript_51753/g.129913  ORF Transcript_51753/g.129913 Transcript_51753/m.129913 type:complete len:216 (+) Transcript_51753:1179-1826(+)